MYDVYLDNAATTRTHSKVAQAAVEMMCVEYGNPSSLHLKGFYAQRIKEEAQSTIAGALGAQPEEVTFTSGGTEANNLAIFGTAKALARRGKKIITTQLEHASVLEPMQVLEEEGFEIIRIAPLPDGSLDIDALEEAVDKDTILVSCMLVNSEIGSVSSIDEAVKRVKRKNAKTVFHTDAVQAYCKIPFSVKSLGVDLLSISGHKIHAPKGIGALYIRKGTRIVPIMHGGGQENGMRPGTENMPGIYAFAKATELAKQNWNSDFAHVVGLCKYFINKCEKAPGLRINSDTEASPYICNISVPGYRSETLLHYLEERKIFVSSGSACSKGAKSHVLSALGLPNQRIDSAIRVSFSANNTTEEIDKFFIVLQEARQELIRS